MLDNNAIIIALGTAITGLAGFIAWLFRQYITDKNALIATLWLLVNKATDIATTSNGVAVEALATAKETQATMESLEREMARTPMPPQDPPNPQTRRTTR